MNTPDFYDIYPYYYLPFWQTSQFRLFCALFCLVVLLIGGFFYYRAVQRRKSRRQLSPVEWALQEIGRLKEIKCTTKHEYKLLYFELTRLIKQFLSRQHGWQVEDKTDEELVECLRTLEFDAKLLAELDELLQGAAAVKFADAQTLRVQAEKDLGIAQKIVEQRHGGQAEAANS